MSHETAHQEIAALILDELDDALDGMAGNNVRGERDLLGLRQLVRAMHDGFIEVVRLGGFLDDLVDRRREVRHRFDADHLELAAELLRQLERGRERLEGPVRAVIGVEDFLEDD